MDDDRIRDCICFPIIVFLATITVAVFVVKGLNALDTWLRSTTRNCRQALDEGQGGRCFACNELTVTGSESRAVAAAENKWMEVKRELERQQQLVQLLKEESEEIRRRAIATEVCVICQDTKKEIAFGCGHTACEECASKISICPICREPVTIRLRLFL